MQTATLENSELTNPEAGQTQPDASPIPPQSQTGDGANAKKPQSTPDRVRLMAMGMTKRAARKILAGGGSERWLTLQVTARVNMTFYANSLEQLAIAQKRANQLGYDKSVDARTRVAALAVVAQCGMSIARLGEANLANAARIDDPDRDSEKNPAPQNNTLVFGFPPVATPAAEPQADKATTGRPIDVQVVEPSKSP